MSYRVVWTNRGGEDCIGDIWDDYVTASHVAKILRDSGWCLNVRVIKVKI